MSKTLPLALSPKAGRQIPSVGYGCWKVDKSNAADLIEEAIKCGYRHLDCAADYGNEKQVGEGIRRAIEGGVCKREDLFVTSKLWNTFHRPEHVEAACRRSLQDLGLEYLDLYLIHFPISLKFVPFEKRYPPEWFHEPDAPNPKMELDPVPVQDTWKSMEKLVDAGLVLNIGVSNFNVQAIRDVHSYARVKPAVLQVEMHPYLQQSVLLRFATELGMHVTAYSPMGHGDSYWNESIAAVREKEVIEVAKKHGATEGQVVLRWGVQRGTSVIPKSSNPVRIKQNLDLFGFSLDDDDMKKLKSLDRNMRFNDPGKYCEQVFKVFCPIFE